MPNLVFKPQNLAEIQADVDKLRAEGKLPPAMPPGSGPRIIFAPFEGPPANIDHVRAKISGPLLPEPPFITRGPAPLPFGTAGGLIAEGGTGKTTYTLWEAAHIALDRPLFGQKLERPGGVLFVSAEDPRSTINYRLQRVAQALDLSTPEVLRLEKRIYIEDLTGKMVRLVCSDAHGNLAPTDLGNQLIERYAGRGITLINIDPTNLFGPGERFVNDAEAALMVECQRIAHAIGCMVRLVHHTSKMVARGGIVDQYVGRGGAAFADNSRFQHQLVCHKADDAEYRLPTLATPTDDFVLKRAMQQGRVLRLHTNKLSWGPRPLGPVWLMRDGFQFIWLNPAEFVSQQAQSAQQALQAKRRVVAYVRAQVAAGHRLSKKTLVEDRHAEMQLTRAKADEIVLDLLAAKHLKWVDLPKEECRGRLKAYLAPGDIPVPDEQPF